MLFRSNLTEEGKKLSYVSSQYPEAEKLIKKEFIGFLCLGFPNGKKEMKMIINSFKKIMNNLDELREFKADDPQIRIGR